MEKQRPFNPDNDTIKNWLERFELLCELHEIPEERRSKWCKVTIGDAGNDVTDAISAATWNEWKTALVKELGHPDEENASRRELTTLAQGDLSLRALSRRARQLANRAFTGAGPAIIEREAMEAFLKALSPDLRREVLRTKTTNLESAWEEAERHHQIMQTHPAATAIAAVAAQGSTPSRLEQLEDTIAALQRQLLTDSAGDKRKRLDQYRNREGPKCWNCGKIGHIQRECRGHRKTSITTRPLNYNGGRQ